MFAPWKKSYDQLRQHIKKQRHYFANKGPSSQSYGFASGHVWMSELNYKESWALENRCFEWWCWRRLLRVSCKEIQLSILKEINLEYSLEGLMLKLKLQYFGHLMWRVKRPWCWKRLKVGGEWCDIEWDGWIASPTQWTWVSASSMRQWRTEKPGVVQSTGSQIVSQDLATEQQQS